MKIAIDGPSGAGKSTVAKALSKRLNIAYLDTGAMYRAVALKAKREGLLICKEQIEPLLKDIAIDIKYSDGQMSIYLDGENVSSAIREHDISKLASDISALPAVRLFLVELQRKLAAKSDSVLDGRDIGTFVLPDADYKFYLTADVNERAERRYNELKLKGAQTTFEEVKNDMIERDYNDSHREFAPLRKAADAIEIDSTFLSAEEVAYKMLTFIKQSAK